MSKKGYGHGGNRRSNLRGKRKHTVRYGPSRGGTRM